MRVTQYTVLVAALLLLAGCGLFSLGRPDLASKDPALKIPAMKLAAQQDDKKAIPTLIKALSSQDPAIRFYAIYALHKITGHRFGFIYYASKSRRNVAAARWKRWFATQPGRGFHLSAPKLGHAAPVPVVSGGAS
ncbi:MAG: HEAT repeat domain-containing protein [Phycisphaerae bacterium]